MVKRGHFFENAFSVRQVAFQRLSPILFSISCSPQTRSHIYMYRVLSMCMACGQTGRWNSVENSKGQFRSTNTLAFSSWTEMLPTARTWDGQQLPLEHSFYIRKRGRDIYIYVYRLKGYKRKENKWQRADVFELSGRYTMTTTWVCKHSDSADHCVLSV